MKFLLGKTCKVKLTMYRYGNLQLDDFDQADDEIARLFSGLFFLFGLQIQIIVIFHELIGSIKTHQRQLDQPSPDLLQFEILALDPKDFSVEIPINCQD